MATNVHRLIRQHLEYVYVPFLFLYIFLFAYHVTTPSQWWIDALFSAGFLTVMYGLNTWARMGYAGFIALNGVLLLHNLGGFGAYDQSLWLFGWDNLVHFTASAVAAYYLFNFIARKTHIRHDKRLRTAPIDEHLSILIFLVLASAAMFGVVIELFEFGGAFVLGEGDGLLLAGTGDDAGFGLAGQYADTMTDIIMNILGSVVGTLAYYHAIYKSRVWLKYY